VPQGVKHQAAKTELIYHNEKYRTAWVATFGRPTWECLNLRSWGLEQATHSPSSRATSTDKIPKEALSYSHDPRE